MTPSVRHRAIVVHYYYYHYYFSLLYSYLLFFPSNRIPISYIFLIPIVFLSPIHFSFFLFLLTCILHFMVTLSNFLHSMLLLPTSLPSIPCYSLQLPPLHSTVLKFSILLHSISIIHTFCYTTLFRHRIKSHRLGYTFFGSVMKCSIKFFEAIVCMSDYDK